MNPNFPHHDINPKEFPHLWKGIRPPRQLFAQGKPEALELLHQLPEHGLAIVGTRAAHQRSILQVQEIIKTLKGSPLIILSGLAKGIDATAHAAAINANLKTIAIIGAGLDLNYPRENQKLRTQILESGGLVITEHPIGMPAHGDHFIRRNRLIAGWSKATWVVQAGHRSGAINTASWAFQHHRDTFATPAFPGDPTMAGNQRLLQGEQAYALWDTHSLGTTWNWIHSFLAGAPQDQTTDTLEDKIIQHVENWSKTGGPPSLDSLLEWSLRQEGSVDEFFSSIERLKFSGRLLDKNGLLLKNPGPSF